MLLGHVVLCLYILFWLRERFAFVLGQKETNEGTSDAHPGQWRNGLVENQNGGNDGNHRDHVDIDAGFQGT